MPTLLPIASVIQAKLLLIKGLSYHQAASYTKMIAHNYELNIYKHIYLHCKKFLEANTPALERFADQSLDGGRHATQKRATVFLLPTQKYGCLRLNEWIYTQLFILSWLNINQTIHTLCSFCTINRSLRYKSIVALTKHDPCIL